MFLAVTARRCEISCPRRVELCLRVKFNLKFCLKNLRQLFFTRQDVEKTSSCFKSRIDVCLIFQFRLYDFEKYSIRCQFHLYSIQ